MIASNGGIRLAEELGTHVILWSLEPVDGDSLTLRWERVLNINIALLNLPIEDFLSFQFRSIHFSPKFTEGADNIPLFI